MMMMREKGEKKGHLYNTSMIPSKHVKKRDGGKYHLFIVGIEMYKNEQDMKAKVELSRSSGMKAQVRMIFF